MRGLSLVIRGDSIPVTPSACPPNGDKAMEEFLAELKGVEDKLQTLRYEVSTMESLHLETQNVIRAKDIRALRVRCVTSGTKAILIGQGVKNDVHHLASAVAAHAGAEAPRPLQTIPEVQAGSARSSSSNCGEGEQSTGANSGEGDHSDRRALMLSLSARFRETASLLVKVRRRLENEQHQLIGRSALVATGQELSNPEVADLLCMTRVEDSLCKLAQSQGGSRADATTLKESAKEIEERRVLLKEVSRQLLSLENMMLETAELALWTPAVYESNTAANMQQRLEKKQRWCCWPCW